MVRAATELLSRIGSDGDTAAAGLLPLVYDELRRLAGSYMRQERLDHTLQPTALVHEAYMRMIDPAGTQGGGQQVWKNRAHFIGVAAKAMRRVLVDHARGHNAAKRGGRGAYGGGARVWERVTLDEAIKCGEAGNTELLELDEALEKLAAVDPRGARVVELRFFGGLTIAETAEVLGVADSTVEDDWAMARAWLGRELAGRGGGRGAGA
jgi:RNA polymerase sigma factor (TIGR02999 family)